MAQKFSYNFGVCNKILPETLLKGPKNWICLCRAARAICHRICEYLMCEITDDKDYLMCSGKKNLI